MPRNLHIYEFLCIVGVLLIAGTIGAAEMGSIGAVRMVVQIIFGLFVTVRYGVKSAEMFCRRADR